MVRLYQLENSKGVVFSLFFLYTSLEELSMTHGVMKYTTTSRDTGSQLQIKLFYCNQENTCIPYINLQKLFVLF